MGGAIEDCYPSCSLQPSLEWGSLKKHGVRTVFRGGALMLCTFPLVRLPDPNCSSVRGACCCVLRAIRSFSLRRRRSSCKWLQTHLLQSHTWLTPSKLELTRSRLTAARA
eukprot:5458300-Pleurochrysis_carterae.AAC.7